MGYTNTNWTTVNIFRDRASAINAKEHFTLARYDVTMKEVAKVRFGSHCKYNINYHFVWIPKTRMSILVEPFRSALDAWLTELCKKYGWIPLALEIMPDHIHFFLSAHPKWAPMRIVKTLKERTSARLRAKYSIIRDTRCNEQEESVDFWATGYYCGTAGHVSAAQVARYIMEQTERLKKNWKLFDIKPFEYDINDAIKEDKTQTKLAAFGGGEL